VANSTAIATERCKGSSGRCRRLRRGRLQGRWHLLQRYASTKKLDEVKAQITNFFFSSTVAMLLQSFCHARNHHLKAPICPQLHLSQLSPSSAVLFTALVWFPALFHFHLVSWFCFFHDSSLPPSVSVLFLPTQPLFHFSLVFHFWF